MAGWQNALAQSDDFAEGLAFLEQQQYDKAINYFSKAIESDSKNHEAYYYRGLCYARFYDHKKAIEDFNEAIRLHPSYADAYYERALSKAEQRNYPDAVADLEYVLRYNSKPDADFYFNRGIIRSQQGDIEGAIKDFNLVIGKNPDDRDAYFKRGLCKIRQGNEKGAMEDFLSSLNMISGSILPDTSDDPATLMKLAREKQEENQLRWAVYYYTIAISTDTVCTDCYIQRALCRLDLADFRGAAYDVEKVIRIDPDNSHAHLVLGYSLTLLHQLDEGCPVLSKAAKLGNEKATGLIKKLCANYY